MKNTAYIALGTNQGDRKQFLEDAIKILDGYPHISIRDYSSIYETDPVGFTEQPRFLNMVIKLETSLTAFELLEVTQKIENDLGRKREVRWGPRTIDLDILLYNNENIESEHLTVPHPRMFERAFVLVPLLEIKKDFSLYKIDVAGLKENQDVSLYVERNKVLHV